MEDIPRRESNVKNERGKRREKEEEGPTTSQSADERFLSALFGHAPTGAEEEEDRIAAQITVAVYTRCIVARDARSLNRAGRT